MKTDKPERSPIRVSAVSYYNTRPFLYGLEHGPLAGQLDISLDIPSEGARKLRDAEVQLGLVPVGILDQVPEAEIISPWCIGCDGPVRTVCLYAEQPLEKLDRILLDYHSVTSVRLMDLLLREYWHCSPELVPAEPGFREQIGGSCGGLVIGDRSIGLESRFPYVYDLGEAWKKWTGMPFVFAVWVSTRRLPDDFIQQFNDSLAMGLEHLEEVIHSLPPIPHFDPKSYYREAIQYGFDAEKQVAMERFLRAIGHRIPAKAIPAVL